jgi:DALR anticodon binding domain
VDDFRACPTRALLKFSDLANVRTTSYVFDLDRFISFEGKTGPYLLYAAVCIKSLARRAEGEGVKPGPIAIELPAERALVLALDGFSEALRAAYDKRMPHHLCDHAYALATAFSGFYAAAPILVESDRVKRASRFALALATLRQLELAVGLIGIARHCVAAFGSKTISAHSETLSCAVVAGLIPAIPIRLALSFVSEVAVTSPTTASSEMIQNDRKPLALNSAAAFSTAQPQGRRRPSRSLIGPATAPVGWRGQHRSGRGLPLRSHRQDNSA